MDDFNNQSSQSTYGGSGTGTAARMKEDAANAATSVKDKVADTATTVKDKVADLGRKTVDTIDGQRSSAAGALEKTASSMHAGSDKLSSAGHTAADSIQGAADYVRNTDLKGMANDVGDVVKKYPGQSLAVAAVLGFLVARGLRSNS